MFFGFLYRDGKVKVWLHPRLFLYILAKRRGTKSQLSTNLIYAVIAVLFSIGSDKLHWWVIISICLSIYLLLYPLRYLRIYLQKAWKWVFIGSCALLAGGYALDTLQVYLSKFKLIALALWLVSCVASLVFVWLNSEGHKCPKCSRFIVPIKMGERTDSVKTHKEKEKLQLFHIYLRSWIKCQDQMVSLINFINI